MKENSASLNGVSAVLGVIIVKYMLLKVLNYCIICHAMIESCQFLLFCWNLECMSEMEIFIIDDF